MPKGKVAVIQICSKCPYLAFDSSLYFSRGAHDQPQDNHIAYCGWFKPLDNTKLRLEPYIDLASEKFGQPENCPLPDGNDGSKWRNETGEDSGKFPNSTEGL